MAKKIFWIIPLIIFIALGISQYYRWEVVTKNMPYSVIQWKTDRWTGQQWYIEHRIRSGSWDSLPARITERPLNTKNVQDAKVRRYRYTQYWNYAAIANAIFLIGTLITCFPSPKKEVVM